jgi:hypothetical protein
MYETFCNEIGDKINRENLINEDFKNIGKTHDWRKYVNDVFKHNWKDLTLREKQIVFIFCEQQADMEDWD